LVVPISQLDPTGLLPAGVHVATLPEIGLTFGSQNARRIDLFDKLRALVAFANGFGLFTALYVDGSFTTDKAVPGDIDAVLEIPRNALLGLLLLPNALTILDSVEIKATYEIDLFINYPPPGMVSFFQSLRPAEALARQLPPDHTRGILKVDL
jgi:hypothetical protein